MLNKKETLIKLIEEGKIKGCTIIGKPTEELKEIFLSRKNIVEYMEGKGFKVNEYEYERTDFRIYFPQLGMDIIIDYCTVNVSRKINKKELEILCSLFTEIYDYYQEDVPAKLINKICGLYKNEPFTINDLFMLIKDNQSEIARKIGRNRQVISDIKTRKCNITTEILSLLMKEYPLLPYDTYLRDFNK